jgi:hypothetical protein
MRPPATQFINVTEIEMTQTHSRMLTTRRRKKKALKESARVEKQAKKQRNEESGSGGAEASRKDPEAGLQAPG